MRRRLGQAAFDLGRGVHRVMGVLLAAVAVSLLSLGLLGWRLSLGPLDITWLAREIAAQARPEDARTRIAIGSAALAWEGWTKGIDHPLDIRLDRLVASGMDGATLAVIPRARVSLSLSALLFGRIVPRAVEIDGARVWAVRLADGRLATVLGRASADQPADASTDTPGPDPFGLVLAELARPAESDTSARDDDPSRRLPGRWSQLRRVRIDDAELLLADRRSGMVWRAPSATLDLQRASGGGVTGTAEVTLTAGDRRVQLSATAALQPGGAATTLHARFTPVAPAALAGISPSLAILSTVEAPVDGRIDLALGRALSLIHAHLALHMGAGSLRLLQSTLPVLGGEAELDADPAAVQLSLSAARLAFAGVKQASGPVLRLHGALRRAGDTTTGQVLLDIDRLGFADLAQYWPQDADPHAAGGDARAWLTSNLTAGTARAAHAELGFTARAGEGLRLTSASGQVSADDFSVNWLRPVPPIEHAQAVLTIVSPDELLITATAGRQAGGALQVRQGSMRITGLTRKDQASTIDLVLAGPLGDAWTLLHNPRLNLLSRHPVDLGDPSGQVMARLHLELPLDSRVTIEQIPIHSQGQLSEVHLSLAGRDVTQGLLNFDVTGDGLQLGGSAQLEKIPVQADAQLDFRNGPPGQVQTRLSLSGEASIAELAAAGLDSGGLLTGGANLSATLEERRDGSGLATVHGDLQHTGIGIRALGWQHRAGDRARLDLQIRLDHDRIVGIDHVSVAGDGMSVIGQADFAQARPSVLRLERVVLGDTSAAGTIRFGPTLRVSLAGPRLDLSGRFARHDQPAPAQPDAQAGKPWAAELRFDQVKMAGGHSLSSVLVKAEDDGQVLHQADITGETGGQRGSQPFHLSVTPESGGRRLAADAADAGALLAAADVLRVMQGGRLQVAGRFDDLAADHALSGTAEISDFRLRGAPVAAKLLQAMTLYGLVEALQGPGLGVNRMIVPFRYAAHLLDISQARAFSASLGVTLKGQIDLDDNSADLQGTIVPAYFFNRLLGDLPVVGRLFSPEKGGGVLAATYGIHGNLNDPAVSVNPLAALTPGFLRGVFGRQ